MEPSTDPVPAKNDPSPPVPRPAATVMLVREAGAGFELYMLRRSEQSSAFPELYVFPGGSVDRDDAALAEDALLRHHVPAMPDRLASVPAHEVAALREAFEEAGFLLATGRDGKALDEGAVAMARAALLAGRRTFRQVLEDLGAVLDARRLWYFSNWITPPTRPKRFDTHFYLAEAPAGQHGSTDDYEVHDGIWIAPAEALRRQVAGELPMIFPTIKHLERLAPYQSLRELRAFATTKSIRTVQNQNHKNPGVPAGLEETW